MDYSFKLFTVLFFTIAWQLFSVVSSASLFGVNFETPKIVIRKGVERIPQILDQIHFLNQNFKQPSATPHPHGNNNFNGYMNAYNPAFNREAFVPQQKPNALYEITTRKSHNNAYYNQAPLNINSQGPYGNKYDSKPLVSNTQEKYITEQINPNTENILEFDTDYTTGTTGDEWTTTDEPLNRIGAPPAVVASLLG